MIRTITIDREDADAVVTYKSCTGNVVEQTVFENDILTIVNSVSAILVSDAIKTRIKEAGVNKLRAMSEDDLNDELAEVVCDVFPDHDDNPAGEYGELLDLTHETWKEMNK